MHRKLLLVSEDWREYQALLASQSPNYSIQCFGDLELAREFAAETELLFGDPDLIVPLLPDCSDKLRWIQSSWAGVTPLIEALRQRRDSGQAVPLLTNIRGIFGPLMAEYVFAYLLAHERCLFEHRAAQQRRQWFDQRGGSLQGKTLGLLGLGSIGAELARTARVFGLRVFGCSRTEPEAGLVDQHFGTDQLVSMAEQADYLVCTLPSTDQTRNLIDAALLSRIKPGALLINAGRGDLIVDEALIAALQNGRLAGAVLDVFRQEPLPESHPFWGTPGLLITSHSSAPSFPAQVAPIFVDNLARYRNGEALNYRVDIERGY